MPRKTWTVLYVVAGLGALQALLLIAYRFVQDRRHGENLRPEAVLEGQTVDLLVTGSDDVTHRVSDLRGRPVLLHFWATWCAPCRDELPGLFEFGRELARQQGSKLVAVASDRDPEALSSFFDGPVPAEVMRDAEQAAQKYGVTELPETWVLDSSGVLRLRLRGARDWASAETRAAVLGAQ